MRRIALFSLALALLAGCSDQNKVVLFDGERFRGKIQADREDRRSFTATASPVSASLEGARQAAHYEGTAYCVRRYGSSDINWTRSPDAEAATLSIEKDVLTVQGRCAE